MTTMTKILFFLPFLFSSLSLAQFDKEISRRSDLHTITPVAFEAIPYGTNDTTSIELIILYRVRSSFFYFSKTANAPQDTYLAQGEFMVEIFNENETAVARDLRPLRLEQYSPPVKEAPPSQDIQGVFVFKLKKGLYRIVVEAKDTESGKSYISRDTKLNAHLAVSSGLNISPLILVEPIQSDTISQGRTFFTPINQGGNILLGQTGGCFFQIVSRDTNQDFSYSWKVLSKNDSETEISQELSGNQYLEIVGSLELKNDAKDISFVINKDTLQSRFIFIPVPLERLNPGTYTLAVTINQEAPKFVKELSFNVLWQLRPRSLSDFNLAVDALKHIATEKEIDEMSSDSEQSRKAFRAFWLKLDSDTTNAYNPAIAEYYRRVDAAIKRFSTTSEFDGYRTDRGRIYILFGTPSITNRLLKPNTAPTEIWTYEKIHQRFTFTDSKRNGNFILVKKEDY